MSFQDELLDTGGAETNVRISTIGATGNGTTNDAPKFYALGSRHYRVGPGTFQFNTSGTIPQGALLRFSEGAVLRPASGVTITINALVEAGAYQIFDLSQGGTVVFGSASGRRNVKPEHFAATGASDLTAAFRAAAAALNGYPGVIELGPADYVLSTDAATPAVTLRTGQWLRGPEKGTAQIVFTPTANGAIAVQLGTSDNTIQGNLGVRNVRFYSANTTLTKVAVRLLNTSQARLDRVRVGPIGGWTGNGSIGVQLNGRELTVIDDPDLAADVPVFIGLNPYSALACDHLVIRDATLYASGTNPCISVDGASSIDFPDDGVGTPRGMYISNLNIEGHQAWMTGGYGFKWSQTATAQASHNLSIRGARWEQSTNATGYGVYIDAPVNDLDIQLTCGSGNSVRGVYLRRCSGVRLSGLFAGSSEALNLDECGQVFRDRYILADGSAAITLGSGMEEVLSLAPTFEGGLAPQVAFYDRTSSHRYLRLFGSRIWAHSGTLTTGASYNLACFNNNVPTAAMILCAAHGATTDAAGTFYAGPSVAIKLAGTANTSDTLVSGKLVLFNQGPGGSITVYNGFSETVSFTVFVNYV